MALTAAPLEPGVFQFFDNAGVPLVPNGVNPALLYTYAPGGSTPKTTWQDPTQTNANANPVPLDAAGRCVLFGAGQYRLQLFDAFGNLLWDNLGAAADLNSIQAGLTPFTGDTGSGGTQGVVPAPPAGSAAAGDYLSADGSFQPLLVVVPATPAPNQAGFLFPPVRQMTTTPSALELTDAGGAINYSNTGAGVLTISSDASVAWPTGSVYVQIAVFSAANAGNLTLTQDAGVDLFWAGSSPTPGNRVLAPLGQCVLTRLGANTWSVVGVGLS